MSQSQSKSRIDIVRDIDHYEQNILIIIALSKIYSKYAGESVVGKKLYRMSTERTEVTPDLVTEFKSEDQFWAIISESKSSLPKDSERWMKIVEQLERYDNELENWKEDVKNHDIVMVTDLTISSRFWDYLNNPSISNSQDFTSNSFRHNLAILGYARDHKMNNDLIVIKKDKGKVSNRKLDKNLEYAERVA